MYTIIRSTKGRNQIKFRDNIYTYKRRNVTHMCWTCSIEVCRSKIFTVHNYEEDKRIVKSYLVHTHESIEDIIFRKELINKMKAKILDSECSVREAINWVLRGCPFRTIELLGNQLTIARTLRRYAASSINPKPYINPEIDLSTVLCKTHSNDVFYQYGPGNYGGMLQYEGILLFFSWEMGKRLLTKPIWSMDGTFTVVKDPHYQLYTIGFIEDHHVFPCVFAFLKNKTEETYLDLFGLISNLIGEGKPDVIKTDFEKAAINAMDVFFPDATISGCLFHLGQSVYKKVINAGLSIRYQTSNLVRKYVKALTALSFVKESEILETYNQLKAASDFPNDLEAVYVYFKKYYIDEETCLFEKEIWNACDLAENNIPRTNNAIEAWHGTLKRSFGGAEYSFYRLVSKLKNEEDSARRKYYQLFIGLPLERSNRYLTMEETLIEYLQENEETNFGYDFIMGLVDKLFY